MSDIKLDWGTGIPPIAATMAKDEIISQQRAEIERLCGLLREALDRASLDRMDGLHRSDVENWAKRVREALGE